MPREHWSCLSMPFPFSFLMATSTEKWLCHSSQWLETSKILWMGRIQLYRPWFSESLFHWLLSTDSNFEIKKLVPFGKCIVGWGDGSVCKVLIIEQKGPEFHTQHSCRKPVMSSYVCKSCNGELDRGRFLLIIAYQPHQWSPGLVRVSIKK